MLKDRNESDLHGTLGGNIKAKQPTTNDSNGRDGVNVSDGHLSYLLDYLPNSARNEVEQTQGGGRRRGALQYLCARMALCKIDCPTESSPARQ